MEHSGRLKTTRSVAPDEHFRSVGAVARAFLVKTRRKNHKTIRQEQSEVHSNSFLTYEPTLAVLRKRRDQRQPAPDSKFALRGASRRVRLARWRQPSPVNEKRQSGATVFGRAESGVLPSAERKRRVLVAGVHIDVRQGRFDLVDVAKRGGQI